MTVYQDKSKKPWRWRYRTQITLADKSTERISGSAPAHINTKTAALAAEHDHIERVRNPHLAPKPMRRDGLRDFAAEFMRTYSAANNKDSERDGKQKILDAHLLPEFGDLLVAEIVTRRIEEFKAKLLKDGKRSRKTVNNILVVLKKILNYAAEIEVIEKAPRIKLLKIDRQAFEFLDFEQYAKLVAAASDRPERLVAVLLGGDAGLRLGEIRALKWSHVDLEAGRLTVKKAFWKNVEGTTKGMAHRKVPLTAALSAALMTLKRHGPYVLGYAKDNKARGMESMRHHMIQLVKLSGIQAIQWHALRHTFCSHLALLGAPIGVIRELAGHTDVKTTLRYMHLVPGATEDAIRMLDAKRLPKE